MSAGDNLELARRLYDAFGRRDFTALTELVDPEIEVLTPKGAPEEGSYRGYEEVARHVSGLEEPFEDLRIDLEELIEANVVVVHVSGRGRASGLPLEGKLGHVLTVREGRVVRLRAFPRGGRDAPRAEVALGR